MRAALATVCCYLLAAGGAAAAHAPHVEQRIVPGQSIGKVALGMTLAQVRKALGAPESVIEKRQLGFGKTFVEYSWNFTEWRVALAGGRVVRIGSSVRTEKTKEGVGVGTLGTSVQRKYGVRCLSAYERDGGWGRGYWCVVRARGGARTAFVLGSRCKKPRFHGNCPGDEFSPPEVFEVRIFASGEQLPVELHSDMPLP